MAGSLPANGSSSWGTPLNDYIEGVAENVSTNAANLDTHETANDPHGDRAYALAEFTSLNSKIGAASGIAQLDSSKRLPVAQLPSGMGGTWTTTFDAVRDYAVPVKTTQAAVVNCSTALQNALNAAGTAGGGEVWVGAGYYGIATTLEIKAGTWLHLAPGAVMVRMSSGTYPAAMIANFNPATSSTDTSGQSNILIDGGQWNFNQGTTMGSPIVLAAASNLEVRSCQITYLGSTNSSYGIILASVNGVNVHECNYYQGSTAVAGSTAVSQQKLGSTNGYTFPSGMTGSANANVLVQTDVNPDTWHNFNPLGQYFSVPSGGFAKYRLTNDNTVRLTANISANLPNGSNAQSWWQLNSSPLPSNYRPGSNHYFAVATWELAEYSASNSAGPMGQLSNNGNIYVTGLALNTSNCAFEVEIPLDI